MGSVQPIDAFALVGDVMSWIGLGIGLPLILTAMLIRQVQGEWVPIEIAVIERNGSPTARWFAGGDFHERPLRRHESAMTDDGWADGFVQTIDPSRVRVGDPPDPRRVLRMVGIAFASVGAIGLIVSLLPMFF